MMLKSFALKYWPLALLVVAIVAILAMSHYAEPKHPISWVETFTWPEGVTAWALLLTLIVIAWQSIETRASVRLGEADMQQWVDIETRGVEAVDVSWRGPFELRLQFEAVNNTPYLLTIKKIVTQIAQWSNSSETFTMETGGNRLPPSKHGRVSGHSFYINTGMTPKEEFEKGTQFTIHITVTFVDCLEKTQTQWFGGEYECAPERFARIEPMGFVPDKKENNHGHPKPI